MDSNLPHCTVCLKPLVYSGIWKCKEHETMKDYGMENQWSDELVKRDALERKLAELISRCGNSGPYQFANAAHKVLDAVLAALAAMPAPTDDFVLPCDVRVPPVTTIRAGCTLKTLMAALTLEGRPKHFRDKPASTVSIAANDEKMDRVACMIEAMKRQQAMGAAFGDIIEACEHVLALATSAKSEADQGGVE